MHEMNIRKIDPRSVARASEYLGGLSDQNRPMMSPGPAAQPGPYNRYREMTLEEMLLENRVVFLVGEINHVSASRVIMQMLYLQNIDARKDINFYINSPGGSVTDTLAVYDVMRFVSCDVATYCIGECASGGAVLLTAAAERGGNAARNLCAIAILGGLLGMNLDQFCQPTLPITAHFSLIS